MSYTDQLTHISMSRASAAVALAVVAIAGTAQASEPIFFDFLLDGSQEVPANTSDAFGIGTIEYDRSAGLFDIEVFTDGIELDDLLGAGPNATPIHLHAAPSGSNGPIAVDLGLFSSFTDEGFGILSFIAAGVPIGDFESELLSGGLYLNIHTTSFPGGEIRGQVPTPSAIAALAMGGLLAARRRRMA